MPLKEFQKNPSFKFSQQKIIRNICDTSWTESPKHLPSHLYPPLPTNVKELKPKAAQAADLTLSTHPSLFWRKKLKRTATNIGFPLQAPKKRIAFKSPPCSDLELIVQVTFELSMFYPRITNRLWEIIPKCFIMFSHPNTSGFFGSQLESLPMSADCLGGNLKATNPEDNQAANRITPNLNSLTLEAQRESPNMSWCLCWSESNEHHPLKNSPKPIINWFRNHLRSIMLITMYVGSGLNTVSKWIVKVKN